MSTFAFYKYNKIYGKEKSGRFASFLFIFQLSFSAPLSIASGCVGLAMYATYLFPSLNTTYLNYDLILPIPFLGNLEANFSIGNASFAAIGICLLAVILLYRRINIINKRCIRI